LNKSFIVQNVKKNNFRVTEHATIQRIERNITIEDIKQALLNGEIIEKNPKSKPYPSCLVLGWLRSGDPLHVKCSIGTKEPKLRIVTVYEPSNEEWESDYKTRKRRKR
jgi:hypothetical protein